MDKVKESFYDSKQKVVTYIVDHLGGEFLSSGRHRDVYRFEGRDLVAKVPTYYHLRDINLDEYNAYINAVNRSDYRYAHCIVRNWFDINVLFMEWVDPIFGPDMKMPMEEDLEPYPMWIRLIDSEQVGYTKDGRLVAYDYTCDDLDMENPANVAAAQELDIEVCQKLIDRAAEIRHEMAMT